MITNTRSRGSVLNAINCQPGKIRFNAATLHYSLVASSGKHPTTAAHDSQKYYVTHVHISAFHWKCIVLKDIHLLLLYFICFFLLLLPHDRKIDYKLSERGHTSQPNVSKLRQTYCSYAVRMLFDNIHT